MFPDQKLEPACVVPVSLQDYTSWLENMKENYKQRLANVGDLTNSTDSGESSGRRKRSTFVKPDTFCATLLPSNGWTYGINPKKQGDKLDAAIICDCRTPPWKRVRKQIKYKFCYSEDLVNPNSTIFKKLKKEIEEHVCCIFYFEIFNVIRNKIQPKILR